MADTQKAISYTAEELDAAIPKAQGSLQRAGGTMTGGLTLAADPTEAMQAATKQYVDNKTPTGVVKSVNGKTPDANGNIQIEIPGGSEYELPTASASVKGGVKIGEGLQMDGETLKTKNGVYELIDTITMKESAPLDLDQEPDGTPYRLKAVYISGVEQAPAASSGNASYYSGDTVIGRAWWSAFNGEKERYRFDEVRPVNGKWITDYGDWTYASNAPMERDVGENRDGKFDIATYPYITRIKINPSLSVETVIKIWGVRA